MLDIESGNFELVERMSLKKINYPMTHHKTKKGEVVQSVGSIVSSRPEKRAGSVTSASTLRKRRRTSEEAESDCP